MIEYEEYCAAFSPGAKYIAWFQSEDIRYYNVNALWGDIEPTVHNVPDTLREQVPAELVALFRRTKESAPAGTNSRDASALAPDTEPCAVTKSNAQTLYHGDAALSNTKGATI